MINKNSYNKYLKRKSFIKYANIHKNPLKNSYKKFIIIPCYDEYNYIFETLKSINNQPADYLKNTLVIIVINNSDTDTHKVKNNNKLTYYSLIEKKYSYEFILIDCFSKKNMFNNKIAGVGAARKTGMDYALQFAQSESLLCSLDADTIVSRDYLSTIDNVFKKYQINSATVNFEHQSTEDVIINEGIKKYEKVLKEVAQEIKKSGSPYGYVSLGSTIVCNAKAYVACGGMSKKKATEDFYFLQSLAKYSSIFIIDKVLVFPSSRDTQRVYLGTGFRMQEYKLYKEFNNLNFSSKSFKYLKEIISLVDVNWQKNFICIKEDIFKKIDQRVLDFLISKNLEFVWKKFQDNSKTKQQFMFFFHQWFDALMIIQLLKKLNN